MLVVDLMHEFELGVFKDFLIHLIRLLFACGPETVAEFDRWYVLSLQFCELFFYSYASQFPDGSHIWSGHLDFEV